MLTGQARKDFPRIVNRFNGDRSSDRTLVREATSVKTIARYARWAAKAPSNGWQPILIGTRLTLLRVGACEGTHGWIWRDEGGFEIHVEELS